MPEEGQGSKVKGHPPKDGSVLWLKNKGKKEREEQNIVIYFHLK